MKGELTGLTRLAVVRRGYDIRNHEGDHCPWTYWNSIFGYRKTDGNFSSHVDATASGKLVVEGNLIRRTNSDDPWIDAKDFAPHYIPPGHTHDEYSAQIIPTPTKEITMKDQIVSYAKSTADRIRPYHNYILAFAALIAIDYFFFGGAGSDRIKKVATKLSAKLNSIVDTGLNKICGDLDD